MGATAVHEQSMRIDRSRATQYIRSLMVCVEILGGREHAGDALWVLHATNRAAELRYRARGRWARRYGVSAGRLQPPADDEGCLFDGAMHSDSMVGQKFVIRSSVRGRPNRDAGHLILPSLPSREPRSATSTDRKDDDDKE